MSLTEKWLEVFNESVRVAEEQTGVPSSDWKTAGRKTAARPDGEDLAFHHLNQMSY